jgi:hypothetical protein
MSSVFEQDWTPLTISSQRHSGIEKKSVTVAKQGVSQLAVHARKLDTADTPLKQKVLDPASRQAIVAFRVGPDAPVKRTQTELNTLCGFPPNTIRDIEAGKSVPSPGQLNTLNRVLKTGLRLV